LNVFQINTSDPGFESFENYYANHPFSNFFQSGIFYRFINGLENYSPLLLVCEDENKSIKGSLLAVIQKDNNKFLRYFSSGIIVRGGPLIDQDANKDKILEILLTNLVKITKKKALFIQFRNFSDQLHHLTIFKRFHFSFSDHQNLIIETKSEKEVWNQISKSKKRQISKSLVQGASIVVHPTIEELHQFYLILRELYKKKIHKPLPSWAFFQRFFDLCKNPTWGIIRLIKYNDAIIGGILCPVSSPKTIHEWYVCGLDNKYNSHGIYPSVLATWSAIDYACKNGFDYFDFMGLGNPEKDYGVRDFKLKFGGTLVNYGRFERINNHPMYWIASKGYLLLQFVYKLFSKIT
jgi:lipid II:glycine glycyltransferase (peptidoglycan interpeptide bridge formation enzyme)